MTFTFMTDVEICAELHARIKAQRLLMNLSQEELAARAGVSLGTVRRIEKSEPATLVTFVKLMSALGRHQDLEGVLLAPERPLSIRERLELDAKPKRQRARRKSA